jgi:hypothetical protein
MATSGSTCRDRPIGTFPCFVKFHTSLHTYQRAAHRLAEFTHCSLEMKARDGTIIKAWLTAQPHFEFFLQIRIEKHAFGNLRRALQ